MKLLLVGGSDVSGLAPLKVVFFPRMGWALFKEDPHIFKGCLHPQDTKQASGLGLA